MTVAWNEITLGEFVTLQRGHDLPDPLRRPGNVPVMGSFGLTGYHDESKTAGPGVTVGRSGASYGVVCYCPIDYWPLNTALYVNDFHGNDPRFAYYFLKSIDFSAFNSGSAQPSLNRNFIHPIRVRVPDIHGQLSIAEILSSLDDKIELNRRMNETLEALARAVFKAWFVDFEPVKAKAAGATSFPGMPQEVFDELPSELVEGGDQEAPKGWPFKPVSELFEVNPTRRLSKGTVAPYLEMANMPTHGHAPDEWVNRPFNSGMRFINGDTLVARITPCLENGKTAYVDFLADDEIGWGSTEYIVLRPKPSLPTTYAYCLARTESFREFLIQNMTGTSGRQRVSHTALVHIIIAEPFPIVAQAFGELVDPWFALVRSHKLESKTLAAIRDALLPKLLSGAIRVPSSA
jgi:type I restriction enzyme S subunit